MYCIMFYAIQKCHKEPKECNHMTSRCEISKLHSKFSSYQFSKTVSDGVTRDPTSKYKIADAKLEAY